MSRHLLPETTKDNIEKHVKAATQVDHATLLEQIATETKNTRFKKDLNLQRCRLKSGQRFFAYRGTACWNRLPKDLKDVEDCSIFKTRFVNMLLA